MRDAAERVVIDSGPLIALARMQALEVVGALPLEVICPVEVRVELDAGAAAGYPNVEPQWLKVVELRAPLDPVAVASIDIAEAAVIQLALEQGIKRVCIDETRGRRFACSVGLGVTGSLGLLLLAKLHGALPSLAPVVRRGQHAGVWYDEDLVRRVLAEAGER